MDKSPDAFRTISEVADWLGVPTHVLRFWESRFTQVKPVKRAGGRRYYRPADMVLLGGIKRLLHDEGLTIRGVQKMLREDGVRHVSSFSQPLDTLEPMRDVNGPGDADDTPMAVDVEPEVADNVVPLMPPAAAPVPPVLVLPDPLGPEPPAHEPEAIGGAGPSPLVLRDQLAPEPPEAMASAEVPVARDLPQEPQDDGTTAAPHDEGTADTRAPDSVAVPDSLPEGGDRLPEFSFLRRRAQADTAPVQPDLFATPTVPDADAAPVANAPAPASTHRAIPATPDVPGTDAADDDPYTPARPGLAARLATGLLRADPAVIARVVADLRDLRARL